MRRSKSATLMTAEVFPDPCHSSMGGGAETGTSGGTDTGVGDAAGTGMGGGAGGRVFVESTIYRYVKVD